MDIADPASTEAAAAAANAADLDSPVRILVQTQTHLVPGDRFTEFGERYDAMVDLICRHVWQRAYDKFRERVWTYHTHFALDNVECWFLIDHHGPDPSPPPEPQIIWHRWTGTELFVCLDLSNWMRLPSWLPNLLLQRDATRPAPS